MNQAAQRPLLVAGIGNIFLGDDGFGCEVVRQLGEAQLPQGVRVIDFGIRGLDVAYAMLDPYEAIVLVDAIQRGGQPGTVYLLQPVLERNCSNEQVAIDPHSMDPVRLLAMARSLGEIRAEMFIVGCEPLDLGDELEGRMGLSEIVQRSVPEAVRTVTSLIERLKAVRSEETASCV